MNSATISFDIKLAVAFEEFHQIERSQITGRIIDKHIFAARIRGIDRRRIGASMPIIDSSMELNAGIAANMGRFTDGFGKATGLKVANDSVISDGSGMPFAVIFNGSHKIIGHPNTVVGVLEEHRIVCLAAEGAVVAGFDERPGFLFFVCLAINKLQHVGVLDIKNDHFGGAPRLTAGLDDSSKGVIAAHKGNGSGGKAAGR